jgi:hypothetical protein
MMKNFRISLLHIDEHGQEANSRDAEAHLIQIVTEMEVFSVEVSRRSTRQELSNQLISLANQLNR